MTKTYSLKILIKLITLDNIMGQESDGGRGRWREKNRSKQYEIEKIITINPKDIKKKSEEIMLHFIWNLNFSVKKSNS